MPGTDRQRLPHTLILAVNHDTHFKGWAKPGPFHPAPHGPPIVPAGQTLDALSGHFRIYQLRDGHRFSTDDVLTAWYGTSWAPSAHRVLDLGSGIGSVGMIAAWRLPGATLRDGRGAGRERGPGAEVGSLQRPDRIATRFARAISATPKSLSRRTSGSISCSAARHTSRSARASKAIIRRRWRAVSSCAATSPITHAWPRPTSRQAATFACVFPEEQRERVERAARAAALVIVRRRPVVFREGEPPLIELFAMMRAADLPERMRNEPGWNHH